MSAQEDEEGEKSEYFYRLIHLVVDLGTEVLLELFKKDIPQGQTVETFLNSKANESKIRKTKTVLNNLQIGILTATPPDVSRFDISLLYILICNLTNIDPPIGGWNQASPIPSDRSAGALLMNFKLIRNEAIAHWPKCTMKKSDFEMFWKRTKNILVDLAGDVDQTKKDHVEVKIEEIKTKQLVEDQRCKLNTQIIGQLQEDTHLLQQKVHALEDQSKSQEVKVTFSAAEKENDQMKHDLQKELVNHYRQNGYCKMLIAALIDDEEIDIEQLFVEPLMKRVKRDSFSEPSSDKKSKTSFEEIFREERRVCVSGNAGKGKTTLCQMIVSSWCKVHDNTEHVPVIYEQFLKPFDYLFYIPLRNHSVLDVVEMIETSIVRNALHGVLKEVLDNGSEKCLIILDGLDEWMPSEDCKHKVPYIDPKEKFTVLITSRTWKLEVLRPKMSEIGQEVELCEIGVGAIVERMVKFLNKKYGKDRKWQSFRSEDRYEMVEHLAEIPILLTHMVCMWHDDEKVGNTRVEIYSKMLDYLFKVAFKRDQERGKQTCTVLVNPQKSNNTKLVNVFKDCSYCLHYSELLSKLSVLAFHSLFNEKKKHSLVFQHSVTELRELYKLTENDIKFCLSLGILTQSKFSEKANSELKKLSFLHKTVQEFFAAILIAFGREDTCFYSMLKTLISLDDVLEMSQVLMFLSGLKPDLLGAMGRHVAQLTDKDERVLQYRSSLQDIFFIHYSVQHIIQACIDEVPQDKKVGCKVVLNDYDMYLDKCEKMTRYLDLNNVKSFSRTITYIERAELSRQVVKLCVTVNLQDHVRLLIRMVERCVLTLKCLGVEGNDDSVSVSLNGLIIALNKCCHLTCFKLSSLGLTHSDIENLGAFLSHKTELREIILHLIQCTTCEQGRCNYRIDLSHHKQLQYLQISYLDGDIVLSDEVPLEQCHITDVKVITPL